MTAPQSSFAAAVAANVDKDKMVSQLRAEKQQALLQLESIFSSSPNRGQLVTLAEMAATEVRRLRTDRYATEKGQEESARIIKDLQRKLANQEQISAQLREQLREQIRRDAEGIQRRGTPECYGDDEHSHATDGRCLTESDEILLGVPGLPDEFIRAATAALEAFADGYREYGPGAADSLGLAGQWGDLHRKVAKLKPVMWEGDSERLKRETPQEVLRDIIGHALLALDMYERGLEPGR